MSYLRLRVKQQDKTIKTLTTAVDTLQSDNTALSAALTAAREDGALLRGLCAEVLQKVKEYQIAAQSAALLAPAAASSLCVAPGRSCYTREFPFSAAFRAGGARDDLLAWILTHPSYLRRAAALTCSVSPQVLLGRGGDIPRTAIFG